MRVLLGISPRGDGSVPSLIFEAASPRTAFEMAWSRDDEPPLFPPDAQAEILEVNERIYHEVNDGVYRCGFARTQAAYDEAVERLFKALDWLEDRLSTRQWLVGPHRTEADWRLFPTLIRFEYIYRGHFRCSRRSLTEYPALWAYTRALFQVPGVADVTEGETRRHYYLSHKSLNPSGILPVAPELICSRRTAERRSVGRGPDGAARQRAAPARCRGLFEMVLRV